MRLFIRWLLLVFVVTSLSTRLSAQTPFVGEIKVFAGNFAPTGWAMCDGSLLQISQYDVLFNLIGTTYGGDGQQTFALPDLRGRVAVGQGQGPGLSSYTLGQTGGVETVTLTTNQIPSHTHAIEAALAPGSYDSPVTAMLAGFRGSVPVYSSSVTTQLAPAAVGAAGSNQPHDNMQPYVAVNYIISLTGIFPSRSDAHQKQPPATQQATSPYLGQILLVPYNFAPNNWADCAGQILPIAQYTALFSLLGTTYGGDGRSNFALPDLRSRVVVHAGSSSNVTLGEEAGEETHTLTVSEMPAHFHVLAGSATATTSSPKNAVLARTADGGLTYSAQNSASTGVRALGYTGGGQPHENRQPYVTLRYIISLTGVFPSRP